QFLMLHFHMSDCQQQNSELEVRSVFLNCDLEKLAVTVKLCDIPSIVTGVFGANIQKGSRSHLLHKQYSEDTTSTKYDTLDNSDVYHMDTSNAFSEDRAQMSYFENTEYQSVIHNKGKILFHSGKNKINNLTNDNQYVLYEIGNAELWYKSQIEVFEKMTLESKIMWNDLTKREIASVSSLDPLWKNQDMSVSYLTKDVVKREDFDLPSGGLCLVLPLNYARENLLPKDINISDDPKLICRDMSEMDVLAAGFSPHEGRRRVRSACYCVLFLLFLFGLLKACVGIILPCVGLMGMEYILKIPRKLDQYYEGSLRGRPVVYDKEGWPVHPDTKKRTVRLVSKPMEFILNLIMFIILPCILLWEAVMQMINKCKTEEKFRGKYQNTKKCFSSKDMQNVEPRWRRRKGDMRKWMTPQAEALSADIWDYGLSPTGEKKCDCRQPLLNDITRNELKQQILHDSEQDDTAYVLTQIQKSKESLKH
ncbi:unnamed protein product, partial [Pieris brassicae]